MKISIQNHLAETAFFKNSLTEFDLSKIFPVSMKQQNSGGLFRTTWPNCLDMALYPCVHLVFQRYYKSVTTLKTREDDIRRTHHFNKSRGEELKKGKHHLKYYPLKHQEKNASENVVC